jgi:hypothetical protein
MVLGEQLASGHRQSPELCCVPAQGLVRLTRDGALDYGPHHRRASGASRGARAAQAGTQLPNLDKGLSCSPSID